MPTIVVVNPNSTHAITRGLEEACQGLSAPGVGLRFVTLAAGPPGIETDAHIEDVRAPLVDEARRHPDAGAFVVACFSDPGLHDVRGAVDVPVLGIARAGIMTALTVADRAGVVSIMPESVTRHHRLYDELGVATRIAGDRPVGLHVTELATHPEARGRLHRVGRELVDDGAGALVLGCTGMAAYRAELAANLGRPVLDPTVCAVSMALGVLVG